MLADRRYCYQLRSEILPLFRGLRLERALEQGRKDRLSARVSRRPPRWRRGTQGREARRLVRPERVPFLQQARLAVRLNVLHTTHSGPDYIPPPRLAADQVVLSPAYADRRDGSRVASLRTPAGAYDIAPFVAQLPASQQPDLVVVRADSSALSRPANLSSLRCPAVLVVGDSHHSARADRRHSRLRAARAFRRRHPRLHAPARALLR